MSHDLDAFVLPRIRAMHGYVPGLQTEDPEVVKLNTNENPFPVSQKVREALLAEIDGEVLQKYPNPTAAFLRAALGRLLAGGAEPNPGERILVGNGSDEVLSILFRTFLDPDDSLVFARPTYSLYPVLADIVGARCIEVDVGADWQMDLSGMLERVTGPVGTPTDSEGVPTNDQSNPPAPKIVIITNPNAPTGLAETKTNLLEFARKNPALTLVDEAYVAFGGESVAREAGTEEFPRLMVCSTYSKSYSLAGQRIGWLVAHPELIRQFDKVRDSYNLSRLAQTAGLAALEDLDEQNRRIAVVVESRTLLLRELREQGFECLESKANFIFVRPPARFAVDGKSAARGYFEHLEGRKIMVRYFPSGRIGEWVRITVGTPEQNQKLLAATRES